jgi:dTDP-4-amino-4,6-dideoxygalactose transaminase
LEVLDQWIANRRSNHKFYHENLKQETILEPEEYFSNRWLSTFLFGSFNEREKIRLDLAKENIEARPLWKPMHLQPIFSKYPAYLNGISESLFDRGLCLPSGSSLENSDLIRIKNTLNASAI